MEKRTGNEKKGVIFCLFPIYMVYLYCTFGKQIDTKFFYKEFESEKWQNLRKRVAQNFRA